jgi:hypothetical protein
MNANVRLRIYKVGPKGGRKYVASQIVSATTPVEAARKLLNKLNVGGDGTRYDVSIQDGNIRPRC